MKIEVITQCHNYMKRASWHINSIRKQSLSEDDEVKINIAVCDDMHYNYFLEQDVKVMKVPKRVFGKRGYCRNRQVWKLDKDTDYVIFADVDMVYDMYFFQELFAKLRKEDIKTNKTVVGISRMSWPEATIESVLDDYEAKGGTYPVKSKTVLPYGLATHHTIYQTRNVCAGYFQLIHVSHLEKNYIKGETRDQCTFKKGRPVMKSDIQFRKQIGHVTKWKLCNKMYHLNHPRGTGKIL